MSPASRYRLLLGAYPRSYRDARGQEMLAVLLEAEERRGRWSVLPEAVSLVAHGLALRVRRPLAGRGVPPSVSLAGVSLILLLALVGGHQLVATGVRGLGLDGYPESWQVWRVWVDPRWPVQAAWLATGLALVLRWHRTTVVLAWTGVLLHAWLAVAEVATGLAVPWVGDVGPAWDAPFGARQAGWLLLTGLAAALVGGPARLASALDAAPDRSWRRVLVSGALGSAATFCVAPVVVRVTSPGAGLGTTSPEPLLALLAGGTALLVVLRRTSEGRPAALLLVATALLVLATRWHALGPALLAGAALFTAGYALGTSRRAPWRVQQEG